MSVPYHILTVGQYDDRSNVGIVAGSHTVAAKAAAALTVKNAAQPNISSDMIEVSLEPATSISVGGNVRKGTCEQCETAKLAERAGRFEMNKIPDTQRKRSSFPTGEDGEFYLGDQPQGYNEQDGPPGPND